MSSRKSINSEDLNLSLTGSQLSSLSANRPTSVKVPKRPSSAQGSSRAKSSSTTSVNSGRLTPTSDSARKKQLKPGSASKQSPVGNGVSSPKDDFLSLFDSTPPKIKEKSSSTQKNKGQRPAWSEPLKTTLLHGNARVAPEGEPSKPNGKSTYSHSVFQPNSARSVSTIGSDHLDTGRRTELEFSDDEEWTTPRSDGDGILNSHRSGHSKPKLSNVNLNIANNMTTQASSPTSRTPFTNIENSYQNIKHKTPVNQVMQGASIRSSFEENNNFNIAASKIQRCFRRYLTRKRASQAAMKRLMEQKRLALEEQRHRNSLSEEQIKEERKKIREEKARQARQQAIEDLHKKREDKRAENQRKAEEEITLLKSSGKIPQRGNKNTKKRTVTKNERRARENGSGESDGEADDKPDVRLFLQDTDVRSSSRSPRSPRDFRNGSPRDYRNGEATDRSLVTEQPQTPSQAVASSRTSTFDDLMNTLEKLEQEELLDGNMDRKNTKKNRWFDDLDKTLSGSEDNEYLSADKLDKLNNKSQSQSGRLLTDDKLNSIKSFLDEVQTTERLGEIDQQITRLNDELEKPALLVPSGEEIAELEQASLAASEVTSAMLTQRLELEEKKRSVQMLQKALNQQRELTVRHAKETEREMKRRLDFQKDEYEEAIKRHLGFIDQLIDDKKGLSEKCEGLVKELKIIEKKYSDKIRALDESHNVEMRKLRDMHEAAEKLRRERWIDEKTKKIKEMTVKGLEPEIQRLIAKHKSEIKKMKSIQEAELLAADERAGQRYIRMTEELRDQLADEKEAACARERELAKQRYEKQIQQEEEAYQAQRRRLYAEVQDEKERIATQATRQRNDIDKLQRQLEDTHKHSVEAMKNEYEKAREEQERRHEAETRELRERLQIEKESWEENYMKKQETWLVQKERELKSQVLKDRDKEIEIVLQRLEEENVSSREECERVAENRIKRIREKYENELKELERSERQALEKFNEMKGHLTEVEGENARYKVLIQQKEKDINEGRKLLDKLHQERDHVSDIIRQEFADRIVATEEENKRLKNEMSEMKARHKIELERGKSEIEIIQKAKEEEMEEVHKRVKQAISKKEGVVNQLREQYQAAMKRADHLEGLLEQQRKQLLKK